MARYDEEYYEDDLDRVETKPRKKNKKQDTIPTRGDSFLSRHPIITNLVIIIIVAVLGLFITYLSLGLFTNHGETDTVPQVVNMSYSSAVEKLHEAGFKVEIKDSVYFDDVRPGLVVDQFPATGATVKPGRKIYLYINALHPKEVILDPSNAPGKPALQGISQRQALAQLQELGFKNVKVEYVSGVDRDIVLRVMANGKIVNKMQKIPVNSKIVLYVYRNPREANQEIYTPNNYTDSIVNNESMSEDDIEGSEIYLEEDLTGSESNSEPSNNTIYE